MLKTAYFLFNILVLCNLYGQASAANIWTTSGPATGRPVIHISGQISPGDEQTFVSVAARMPSSAIIVLHSLGGSALAGLKIAQIVRDRHFTTYVARIFGPCASACAIIWVSGAHCVAQRGSIIAFHAAYEATTGAYSQEGTSLIAGYLRSLGFSDYQVRAMLVDPQSGQNSNIATESKARQLGIRLQTVFTIAAANSCQAKFCVTVP